MADNNNKWDFCKEKPDNWVPTEKVKRTCMLWVFFIGLALTVGGLYLVWKIGAFDARAFLGRKEGGIIPQNEQEIVNVFHLPWVAGALMIAAAVRYFYGSVHNKG